MPAILEIKKEDRARSESSPVIYPGVLPDGADCVLPVDKPLGLTSFRVVGAVRGKLGVRRVGHAGTLDPMATGLLVVLVGRATKLANRVMSWPKVYTGTIRLGEETPSFDAETEVTRTVDASRVTIDDIRHASRSFVGDITQLTPTYAAVKVGGEPMYRKARRGENVVRPPRHVTVTAFEIVEMHGTDVRFVLHCSSGTYVRTIAHDLGQALGVGGHLTALRRTHIGDLAVSDAWKLDQLPDLAASR